MNWNWYWKDALKFVKEMEARYPGQHAKAFVMAAQYNTIPDEFLGAITSFVCMKEEDPWSWSVEVESGARWVVSGRCDKHGWGCHSYLHWKKVV